MTLRFSPNADARIPMLGASGAISAVLGAFLALTRTRVSRRSCSFSSSRIRLGLPGRLVPLPAPRSALRARQPVGGRKRRRVLRAHRRVRVRLDRRTGAARHATDPPSVHPATIRARAALSAAMREVVYVAATAGALLFGAALGCFRTPPRQLTAGMLAFAAGALVVAVAFELFEPAHREAGLGRASAALLFGASAFIAVDLLLQRYAGAGAVGLALVAAVTLDGVPENFALGVGLAESGSMRSSPRSWPRTCRRRSAAPPTCARADSPRAAFSSSGG